MRMKQARMKRELLFGTTMIAALALAGCNKSGEATKAADTSTAAPATPAATPAAPAFLVGLDAVKDVRLGMTLAEVEALGHRTTSEAPEEGMTCSYARIAGLEGVDVMLDSGRIVRFDIALPAEGEDAAPANRWRTAEGAGLGTTEAELRRLYGARMLVEANKYDEKWHDLVIRAEGSNRALLFQTDGSTVQSWRTGDWDAVQLVEGCS